MKRFLCDLCGAEIKMPADHEPFLRSLPITHEKRTIWGHVMVCDPCTDEIRGTVDLILKRKRDMVKLGAGCIRKIGKKRAK